MPSMHALLMAQRRRVVLNTLAQAPACRANETVLRLVVERLVDVVTRELVRADLEFLEQHGLVNIERMPMAADAELWLASLTDNGRAVARGMAHQGVADRELD